MAPERPRDRAALVARLVDDAAPVRPLRPPGVRLLGWMALVASLAAVLAAMAMRPDVAARLASARFAAEVAALALAATGAAGLALRLAVPGTGVGWPLVIGVAASAALGVGLGARPDVEAGDGPTLLLRCAICTVVLGTLPAVALLRAIRRGAPLLRGRAAAAAGGAAFLVALALMRLVCRVDAPLHLLASHVAPAAVATAVAALAGRRWVAHWRR